MECRRFVKVWGQRISTTPATQRRRVRSPEAETKAETKTGTKAALGLRVFVPGKPWPRMCEDEGSETLTWWKWRGTAWRSRNPGPALEKPNVRRLSVLELWVAR